MVGVCSWKSIHESVVPMFVELDCASNVVGVFPLTVYIAVMAFPVVVPLM